MTIETLCASVEAILFASGEPVEGGRIAQVLGVEEDFLHKVMKTMQDKYDSSSSGLQLMQLGESYQLCTKPVYAKLIQQVLFIRKTVPLSNAAMEVLAIIAYNQPVTRAFVEQVRGVDSAQVVSSLVEKGLVEEAGRLEIPGRPIAYQTTPVFLRTFGISSLAELPSLPNDENEQSKEIVEKSSQD